MDNYKRIMAGKQARSAGNYFEEIISTACAWYAEKGLAYIKKTPEPMRPLARPNQRGQFTACFTERAQPDYQGTLQGGGSIVFEAKHTEQDKIERSRVTPAQMAALENHHNLGAAAFVLVSLKLFDYYRIPWAVWRDMAETYGRRHMKAADLEMYRIPLVGGRFMFLDGLIKEA